MNSLHLHENLARLAEQTGVQTSYHDLSGEVRYASPDSLVAVLRGLGIPLDHAGDADKALEWLSRNRENRCAPHVIVAWEGRYTPPENSLAAIFPELPDGSLGSEHIQTDRLEYGYYRVRFEQDGGVCESLLISAPQRCREPEENKARLGLFAPFYALHSKSSIGIGDFSDARQLIRWAGKKGIDIIGTLPLSAQFLENPFEPSPYQPASRLFWNEIYIDPKRLPEYRSSKAAHRIVASATFEKERKLLSNDRLIDYRRIASLKRQVLEILAAEVAEQVGSERNVQFMSFISSSPDVVEFARFQAMLKNPGESIDEQTVRYHLYTQWIVREQLSDLIADADSQGIELYLDLPLGSHPQGYDHWKYRDLFVSGISIGAPPDPLGPEGQVWGIPPINPFHSRKSGHTYLRQVIRRHTEIAGLLRIDHVMGLHRLFWIPDGMPGSHGVYVRYPAEELWAILTLESHLNRCRIVGEDLGTVPDEVREAMSDHGVGRLYVLPFEVDPRSENPVKHPPQNSVASLNTHDLVPFAGYWTETDIDDRIERAGLAQEDGNVSREERKLFRETLERECRRLNVWVDTPAGETASAIRSAHNFLAAGDAGVVLVNIEDLWGETEPQNRPGTVDPVPNWRHKFAKSLEDITADPGVSDQINQLAAMRGKGTAMSEKKIGRKVQNTVPADHEILPEAGHSRPVFRLTDQDRYLFNEGSHLRLYDKLGAHTGSIEGVPGVHFAVWAPDAESVHVIGSFNGWNRGSHPLFPNNSSGIWEGFIPGVGSKCIYKYFVRSRVNGFQVEKADPFAFHAETPPKTGSIVWDESCEWHDEEWMKHRGEAGRLDQPLSIYELHLGSWRRIVEQGARSLNYRELAEQLPDYLKEMGFTHVEFLPLMEHPFYGSWGYQTTGFFAPSSRYGTPQDLMYLIDRLHQNSIGVILDWVPSHFPSDEHGLAYFDGTHLYEHADPKQGFHPDWGSSVFNYGRNEVRSFLLSSGMFWLDRFHADGLRVDAVASMLYLDYSRKEGEWVPNRFGGRENLEAISFLQRLNEEIYARFPGVQVIAEESTSWPGVSRPTYLGGLGFGLKWDMGWMHDILDYFSRDSIHRRYHHNALTFRMLYAWHENFLLPFSHDEVVHGKGSLIGKMPGDLWQKFANLRLLFTVQFTQPGKKLLFMGGEFGQWSEWDHDRSLDWHLLNYPNHSGLQRLVADLNRIYRREAALHELDCEQAGFEWIDCNDAEGSTISYLRWNRDHSECLLIVLNFTPVTRFDYRLGVPWSGLWQEIFNSDSEHYAGSDKGNFGEVYTVGGELHGRPDSISITLPPLGGVILKGSKANA